MGVEELDKVVEKPVVAFEFVAQRPAELQVVVNSNMEITHRRAPGQTIASERNASVSHLA